MYIYERHELVKITINWYLMITSKVIWKRGCVWCAGVGGVGTGGWGRVWLGGTALASRRGGQREKMMAFYSLSVERSWRGKGRQPQPHIPEEKSLL